jgi:uncharacterized protein YggU (UPF0235/DUF167 family)
MNKREMGENVHDPPGEVSVESGQKGRKKNIYISFTNVY